MSFKSRGLGTVTSDALLYHYNKDGSLHHTSGPYGSVETADYEETTGVNTPHYYKLVRQGKLIPYTPFHQYSAKGSWGGHTFIYYKSGEHSEYLASDVAVGDSIPSKDYLDTIAGRYDPLPYLQSAAARVYSQGFDALTFLIGLKDAVKMFRGVGYRLLDLLSQPRFKKIGNAWLEGRFGWRLLIYDILDLSRTLSSLDNERTRFSERVGNSFSIIETGSRSKSHTGFQETISYVDHIDISIRGSVCADFVPSDFQFNPFVTAWDVIPFSFVIDWLLSVGSAIEAASLAVLAEDMSSCVGFHVSAVRQPSRTVEYLYSNASSVDIGVNGTCTATLTIRSPTSIPTIPQINPVLTEFKVLDLVALLIQRYSRR